jgi:hypothetical protein
LRSDAPDPGGHAGTGTRLERPDESATTLGRLSTFGLLRHETAEALHGWMSACVSVGLIAMSKDQFRTLALTDQGRAFMQGRLQGAPIHRPSVSGWSRLRGVRAQPLKAHSSRDLRRSLSRRFR